MLPFTRPSIDEETIAAVADVLRSGWLTTGPRCAQFEAELSAYLGGRPVRLANSGTATLELGLRLAGVGEGDEVITTPLTWVGTANVILAVGARPVFVDVDPHTRNLDLAQLAAAITPATRAIIPVDLAGLPVDRDALYVIANAHRLRVIEDAAQSFGATDRSRRIGSFGDLISFSFHANKNLTTGEGGCLVLNDEDEARRFEKLRLQGVTRYPDGGMDVDVWGAKANMTDIAAAIGLGQLRRIEAFTARRRELARLYKLHFEDTPCLQLPPHDHPGANWHMYQPLLPEALAPRRGEFIAAMKSRGIAVGVHYPALHLFTLYRRHGFRDGQFPHSERIGRSIVMLPLFPAMRDEDVLEVCRTVAHVMKNQFGLPA